MSQKYYDIGDGNSDVYAYYYPAYRMLAGENGEMEFPIKVGRSTDYQERIKTQSRATGMPEKPEIAVVWRTDRPKAAEKLLHGHLDFRGKRLPDAPGHEWFLTSPDEIKRIIACILPDVSIRRVSLKQITALHEKRKELGPLPGGGGTGSGRGRVSVYSGKIIVAKHTDGEGNLVNPRREGTHGERSYNIVLESPDSRISYEDYKKAGGRNNDLKWDYDHDFVDIVDSEDDGGDDGSGMAVDSSF